jgi:uncharacterized membrane protein
MDQFPPPDDRDLGNPYAPPRSAFAPEPIAPLRAGMPFAANDVLNWSWAIFKDRMGICLGIFWGTYGINFGISFGVNILIQILFVAARNNGVLPFVAIFVAYVASMVINMWLFAGEARAYLKIARGQPVTFGEVFQGGRYILTMIGAGIMFGIVLLVPVMVCLGVSFGVFGLLGRESAGGLAFLVIGIAMTTILAFYLSARLMVYFYLIVDRDAGAIESLQLSWDLTRNKAGTMFVVMILALAVYIAGILAFCVGIIFSLPLAFLMFTVTYLALVGNTSPPPKKADLIWEDEL